MITDYRVTSNFAGMWTIRIGSDSGAGTNLKARGHRGLALKLGHRSGAKCRKNFLVVPLHFFWL